jgi:hypothetical protein
LQYRSDGSNKSVASARNCLDIARLLGVVTERFAQAFYGCVNTVFKLNDGSVGPEAQPDLLPRDDSPGMLHQQFKKMQGLPLEEDLGSIAGEHATLKIHFKFAKTHH